MRLYSQLLAALRDVEPACLLEVCDKLVTKAKALELGMDAPGLYGVWRHPAVPELDQLPNLVVLKKHMYKSDALLLRDHVDQYGRTWKNEMLRAWAKERAAKRTRSGALTKIFAEEYILPPKGLSPREHRFFVIGNVARFILVDFDRFEGRKQLVYTPDWERTPYWSRAECAVPDHPGLPRPSALPFMVDFAERFSKSWPFPSMVVDVLIADEKPFFGEAGVFHLACAPVHPEWDEMMGKMWLESCGEP